MKKYLAVAFIFAASLAMAQTGPVGSSLSFMLTGGTCDLPATTLGIICITPTGAELSVNGAAYASLQGPQGIQGIQGIPGQNGSPGAAATVTVGTTTTGPVALVTNVGTSSAAILNFVIPQGAMPTVCTIKITSLRLVGDSITGTAAFSACN